MEVAESMRSFWQISRCREASDSTGITLFLTFIDLQSCLGSSENYQTLAKFHSLKRCWDMPAKPLLKLDQKA